MTITITNTNLGEQEETFELEPIWLPTEQPQEQPEYVPDEEPVLVPVNPDK